MHAFCLCFSNTSASAKYDTYAMKSRDNSEKTWNASQARRRTARRTGEIEN
jgi:hypothetical protein